MTLLSAGTLGVTLLYNHSVEVVDSDWLGPALVFAACGLFYLKKKLLFLYGVLEVGAALGVITFVATTDTGSTGPRLASAATATYFLLRGFDNLTSSEAGKAFVERRGWW
jgi:hypothetical protein